MKTVTCEYFATGEGMTNMVLVISAEDDQTALERFKTIFGDWLSIGAEVHDGLAFDKVRPALISQEVRLHLESQQGKAYIEYYCSLHLNFS